MINVVVAGSCGRMGSEMVRTIYEQEDMKIVAGIERNDSPYIGKDLGEVVGLGKIGVTVYKSDDLLNVLKNNVDVLVDFTNAHAAVETVKKSCEMGVNLVVGTTGFTPEQREIMEKAIKESGVSAVISPNMAVGVNLFFKITGELAKVLGDDYDIEIIEAHHKHKLDAPSGTAIRTGEIIAQVLGRDLDKDGVFGRQRGVIGERGKKDIGFHAIRAGDIVGEHTVLFAGPGERIELTHRAHSRRAFANGALKAIRFVNSVGKTGKIYSSFDVLGL
ncbi:MAG: 4-hydroxy-tetrahydrodipicolinate reductase [Candidatus Hydrothermarchaeota archaeon]